MARPTIRRHTIEFNNHDERFEEILRLLGLDPADVLIHPAPTLTYEKIERPA